MGRKRDDVFVLGDESLDGEPSTEELRHERPPEARNPFAARASVAADARAGSREKRRLPTRPLAAMGLAAAAALLAVLALRSGDRHLADPRSARHSGAGVVEAPVGVRRRRSTRIATAPRHRRRVEPKLRPIRSPRRPSGGREREPTSEQAPTLPPLGTAAPAAALVPLPEPHTSPVAPSRPPVPGGGSGRGPEFSFER